MEPLMRGRERERERYGFEDVTQTRGKWRRTD